MLDRPILVPLDGSELSEKAIPYAVSIARTTKQTLVLLTVWEGAEREFLSAPSDAAKDVDERGRALRQEYLNDAARRVSAQGVQASAEMRGGDPSEALLAYCDEHAPGLLVMATHGRSGIQRMWYGSVASKLMRAAPIPTLLVGPSVLEEGGEPPPIRDILVPLDGSPLSESALRPAVDLAEAFKARLLLARAVRWPAQGFAEGVPDAYLPEIEQELTAEADVYLWKVREALETTQPVERHVLWGSPSESILKFVEQERIGLVVMASHARSGLGRWILGSVAERVIQGTAPVLLIRPDVATPEE